MAELLKAKNEPTETPAQKAKREAKEKAELEAKSKEGAEAKLAQASTPPAEETK
jgi:hypothetical protein